MKLRDVPLLPIVGSVLLLASLAAPWWSFTVTQEVPYIGDVRQATADFGLFRISHRVTSTEWVVPVFLNETLDYSTFPRAGAVFLVTAILVVVALAAGVAFAAVRGVPRLWRRWGRASSLLILLASALVLAACSYAATGLPGALRGDGFGADLVGGFWGSREAVGLGETYAYGWGAGPGWFLAVVGGIAYLAAAFYARTDRPRGPVPDD